MGIVRVGLEGRGKCLPRLLTKQLVVGGQAGIVKRIPDGCVVGSQSCGCLEIGDRLGGILLSGGDKGSQNQRHGRAGLEFLCCVDCRQRFLRVAAGFFGREFFEQ